VKTLLLDQGLPRSTVQYLLELGLESKHVGEHGMAQASDDEILDFAGRKDFVVVTLDADFHTLLAMRKSQAPSVIRIRMEGLKGEELARLLKQILNSTKAEILAGSAISVTTKGIRVRCLPFR
jgi:predicted nuclease of predicted toxin-antitoxin system